MAVHNWRIVFFYAVIQLSFHRSLLPFHGVFKNCEVLRLWLEVLQVCKVHVISSCSPLWMTVEVIMYLQDEQAYKYGLQGSQAVHHPSVTTVARKHMHTHTHTQKQKLCKPLFHSRKKTKKIIHNSQLNL